MEPKYLLFAGDTYYPGGGADDFRGAFDSPVEAQLAYAGEDWAHVAVFDGVQLKIVTHYVQAWDSDEQRYVIGWVEE